MTTKTVAITSGTTWALPSDAYGATAQIICWGAGANGGTGGVLGGVGGISGCVASISGYTLPGSGSVSIQIPAGNSSSACWFNSSATVQASSKSTSTASCVGTTTVGGSAGGGICGCRLGGGGGGGAPGLSSPGGAGSEGGFSCCVSFGGSGGGAGSPSYTATAGGTYGPGGGGNGGSPVNPGIAAANYGGAGGGGGAACGGDAGGAGAPGLIIVIYTPGAAVPLPFSYYDFSEHPGAIPRVSPDDTIKNNSGSLQRLLQPQFSPIAFQSNWLVIDPKHPPRSWTLPEFEFPNLTLLYNPPLAELAGFRNPFGFRNPPQFYRSPEPQLLYPNLTLLYNPPLAELAGFRNPFGFSNPPRSWRFPDPIFPQNVAALSNFVFTTQELVVMRQQIFQQLNPPRSYQAFQILFPNIALRETLFPEVPFQLWPMDFYRHPPPYYRSVEFMPVNFLAKNIPGIPVTPPATFIRNIQPELDQVRQVSPTLTEVRQTGYTLVQLRATPPILSK